jgi:uncharacterized membrane protein
MFFRKETYLVRLYYLILLSLLYFSFYDSSVYYLFFTNTILAYIPFELTLIILSIHKNSLICLLLLLWLLFLPNNFYLITDLFHLSLLNPYDETTMMISKNVLNWYKLFLVSLAVIPTILLGCWSIENITTVIVKKLKIGVYPTLVMACVLFLNTLGIYCGRFMRLNSTDLFSDFKDTFAQIMLSIKTLDNNSIAILSLIYVFSLSLMLGYYMLKQLIYIGEKGISNEYSCC